MLVPLGQVIGPSHSGGLLDIFSGHSFGYQVLLEVLSIKTKVNHSLALACVLDHLDSLIDLREEVPQNRVFTLSTSCHHSKFVESVQLRDSVPGAVVLLHPTPKPQYCAYQSFSKAPLLIGRCVAEHSKIC